VGADHRPRDPAVRPSKTWPYLSTRKL
jgi:hypothetical protein